MGIYQSSIITREYKSARKELLESIFNLSAIAHEQCTSRITQAQHASYVSSIFSRHKVLFAFFVNLDVSCTVNTRQISQHHGASLSNYNLSYLCT